MRICSLVPAGTELLLALGLGEALVGVSAACELPAGMRPRPRVAGAALELSGLSSGQVDRAVRRWLADRRPLFQIDKGRLRALRPELILAQDLCDVCAVGGSGVRVAVQMLAPRPEVVWLHPHRLADVLDSILAVGRASGRAAKARALVRRLRGRIHRARRALGRAKRVRVVCLEWLDPLMACGHWVPDVIEAAGGRELLGAPGGRSRLIQWRQVREADPDVLLLAPCGLSREQIAAERPRLERLPGWAGLSAVRTGRVYELGPAASLSCPGPRLIDGIERIAGWLHPRPRGLDAAHAP